jgi:hypothetical protein
LREWTTEDLQLLSGLLVNTMIATVGAMVDGPVAAPDAEAEIARTAERQLRMILLGAAQWRSDPARTEASGRGGAENGVDGVQAR